MSTYYISASTGNDSRTPAQAQNPSTPWATIQKGATNATSPGDIVHIGPGTYNENVTGFSSGTVGNPIIFEGEGTLGTSTIWLHTGGGKDNLQGGAIYLHNNRYIKFQTIRFDGSDEKATIYSLADSGAGAVGIEFRSCTIKNNGNKGFDLDGTTGIARIIYFNASGSIPNSNHVVDSCSFDGNYGLCVQGISADNCTITNNTVINQHASQYSATNNFTFTAEAFHFGSGGNNNNISNNAVNTFVKDGYIPVSGGSCNGPGGVCQYTACAVKFDAGAGSAIIANNTFHDIDLTNSNNLGDPIFLESSTNNNLVQNNIIYNCGHDAIHMGSPATGANTGNVIDGNTIYRAGCNGIRWSNSTSGAQKNNIIYQIGTGPCCSVSNISSGITFNNNLYYRTSGTNVNGWLTTAAASCTPNKTFTAWNTSSGEINDFFADPQFVTLGTDFHLQQGSPGIGSGVDGINLGAYPTQTFTSPVISNVIISAVNYNQFTIAWTTDIGANSQINYGLTSGYGSSTTLDTTLVTSHSVTVTGLTASTLYHFQVRSAQGANVTLSTDFRAVTVIPRPTSVSIS